MIDRVCGIYLLCHTLDWSQIKFSAVRKRQEREGGNRGANWPLQQQNSGWYPTSTSTRGNYLVSPPPMHYENFTRLKPTLYIILSTRIPFFLILLPLLYFYIQCLESWLLQWEEIHLQPSQSPLLQCHLGVTLTRTILPVKSLKLSGAKIKAFFCEKEINFICHFGYFWPKRSIILRS